MFGKKYFLQNAVSVNSKGPQKTLNLKCVVEYLNIQKNENGGYAASNIQQRVDAIYYDILQFYFNENYISWVQISEIFFLLSTFFNCLYIYIYIYIYIGWKLKVLFFTRLIRWWSDNKGEGSWIQLNKNELSWL